MPTKRKHKKYYTIKKLNGVEVQRYGPTYQSDAMAAKAYWDRTCSKEYTIEVVDEDHVDKAGE